MVFIDAWFLLFTVLAIPAVWLAPGAYRSWVLLAANLTFHWHYAGPAGILPIFLLGLGTWGAYRYSLRAPKAAPRLLAGMVLVVVAALGFYKYTGLARDLTAWLLAMPWSWTPAAAPLAISFFTFEFIHLLSDRGSGALKEKISLGDFLGFAIFFPTLAAGPVKRFQSFAPQLRELRFPGGEICGQALTRILLGLFKKFFIAEWALGLIPPNTRNDVYQSTLALGFLLYFRLYVDISAYSDIAIGLARLLNVQVPENMNWIFLARSFRGWWGRWHLTVTAWFRDYVYFPLIRGKMTAAGSVAAILFTMVLAGLWHGASGHFLVWGAYNGGTLVLEDFLIRKARGTRIERLADSRLGVALTWAAFQSQAALATYFFYYPLEDIVRQFSRSGLL